MTLIRCTQLSKRFGATTALDQVNLELQGGKPIALVGPNGAGKTTLFSLLCGYIAPSSGQIEILDEPAGSPALLGRILALPQDAALDPNFSIQKQLQFFASLQGMNSKNAKAEAMRVLALVGLSQAAKQKPQSLSHGMGKRVAIAQAMIGKPDIVLLDEPTAGLDPANAKKLRALISELSEHTQFIISSHNLDELEKLCDQVVYLEKGQITQSISLQQHQSTSQFITLTMTSCDSTLLKQSLEAMSLVKQVTQQGTTDFLIEASERQDYTLESELFDLLQQHGWQYKQLIHGKRLEDTLFS